MFTCSFHRSLIQKRLTGRSCSVAPNNGRTCDRSSFKRETKHCQTSVLQSVGKAFGFQVCQTNFPPVSTQLSRGCHLHVHNTLRKLCGVRFDDMQKSVMGGKTCLSKGLSANMAESCTGLHSAWLGSRLSLGTCRCALSDAGVLF